tara:strand:+ start:280 stop:1995 length:1716 start_codon:yes stop_codon:yes gene_type:complete
MKVILLVVLIFSSGIFSKDAGEAIPNKTWDISGIGEERPLKLIGKLFYVHQYHLDLAFGRVNSYLCLFRNTEYQKFSNLEDGVGYEAILDNNACQNGEVNLPWLVVSKQATTSDNLVIELSMPNNFADARLKLTLEEETSLANPYGVLTLDYNYLSMGGAPLYNATYESSVLDNNQVQFQATVFLDNGILTGTALGQTLLFYGTKILHNQNSDGYGTVTELVFAPNADNAYANVVPQFFPAGYTKNYPDGNPANITTTNFAYNNNVVKYETTTGYTGQKNQIYNADTTAFEPSSPGTELCVSRTNSWNYVPPKRYGVFNSSGDRITFSTADITQVQTASYNYANPEGNTLWNANPKIKIFSSSWIGTALQCKKLADGTSFGDGLCPGTDMNDPNPTAQIVRINGHDYQNFPLFDVPEGTVLTIDNPGVDGNEYYVRQLGVAMVYPAKPQGDADCDSLTIQPSLTTPDHTFFNYPVVATPRTGAVLVNKLNATKDLFSQSRGLALKYSKDGDEDGDGILNYLDAFPIDNSKGLDADHDFIVDTEDINGTTPFQQDWTNHKHLDKAIFSNYLK